MSYSGPQRRTPVLPWIWLVPSAVAAATLLYFGWQHVWFWMLAGVVFGRFALPRLLAGWSLRRLVRRGDVEALLDAWDRPFSSQEAEATMRPLLRATVLAAYGRTDRAEQVLALARRGQLWERSLEHRILLAVLLACQNAQHERALALAQCMERLPLPQGRRARRRAVTLRRGTLALARAHAQEADAEDVSWLRRAARVNPLLTWPTLYAEALFRVQRGDLARARALLARTPTWPAASCFQGWSGELQARVGVSR